MRLTVVVTPRAARVRVERLDGTTLRVAVTAPPHEGQANAAVIRAVAAGRRKILELEEGPS